MAKFADRVDKIACGVTEGYKKIENGVVGAYKKVEDAFVDTFMAKEGETTADAKARIAADRQAVIDASLEASGNAGKGHR